MHSYWQIKFASLLALNLASMLLAILAICFYISTKDYKKASHIGTFNLLLVCMIQSLTTLPLYATRYWFSRQERVRDAAFLFMYFLAQNGITFSLLIMSLDRVVSLWKPLMYKTLMSKSSTVKLLVACWVVCVGYDAIPFFYHGNKDALHYVPNAYWSVVYHFLTNIVAFFMLLACWVYIVHIATYHHRKHHQACTGSSKNQVIRLKATRLTITILSSYFVLYGPACFYYSMKAICLKECFPLNYHNSPIDIELRFIWKYQALLFTPASTLILCWNKRFFKFIKEKISKKRKSQIDSVLKSTGHIQTQ